MRSRPNTAPQCPECGGSHYPATLGSGARVWCNNVPAESPAEIEQRTTQARERIDTRAALRAERTTRTHAEPLDAIDAARLRDMLAREDFGFPA